MALHVMDEANRCLNCKNPMCQKGCPISTPIPQAIRLLKESGKTIIYISHKVEEVISITDELTVLRDGESVRTDRTEAVDAAEIRDPAFRADSGAAEEDDVVALCDPFFEFFDLFVHKDPSALYHTSVRTAAQARHVGLRILIAWKRCFRTAPCVRKERLRSHAV